MVVIKGINDESFYISLFQEFDREPLSLYPDVLLQSQEHNMVKLAKEPDSLTFWILEHVHKSRK
jgi:hypothetical protein